MQVYSRLLLIFLLFFHAPVYAQHRIILDFTKPTYDLPLDCMGSEILDVRRSYGNPNINDVNIIHEAKFTNAFFTLTSDFSKTSFDSACDFRGARFMSKSAFSEAKFHSLSSFIGASFDSTSFFSGAYFDSTCAFMNANFISGCLFSNVTFNAPCIFSGTHFFMESEFNNVQFHALSNFSYTYFDSAVLFSGAEFHTALFNNTEFYSRSSFSDARFYSTADFSSSHFYSSASFSKAHFDSVANFSEAQFDKDVSFAETHFKNNANLILEKIKVSDLVSFDFSHCILPDTIDFSHNPNISTTAKAIIDFTLADSLNDTRYSTKRSVSQMVKNAVKAFFYPNDTTGMYKKHKINLYNSDVSKIRIDYDHFTFYASESHDSIKTKISTDIIETIYTGLLKNFKESGQMDSYKRLDIDYKRFKAGLEPGQFSWREFWWRFGYEKWRIFIHSVFLIILFSIINFLFIHRLNDKNSGIYSLPLISDFSKDLFYNHKWYQRFFKRCWSSLLYTAIIFFTLALKIDKIRFSRSVIGIVWIIFIHIIGLICIGFMANWVLHK